MDPRALELDPVIHAPARLKILMILARVSPAGFQLLQKDAALTAGNLAAHLKALESAGYVEAIPGFVELKPRTRYALSERGRVALKAYCAALAALITDVQAGLDGSSAR